MSLEDPTLAEVERLRNLVRGRERLRKQVEALASPGREHVKVLPAADQDEAVSAEPSDLASAVRQLNLLRERLADAGKAAGASYARITKLEGEVARYRRAYEALRDVLGTFGEETPGWHRSAMVSDDDFRGWQADAGL